MGTRPRRTAESLVQETGRNDRVLRGTFPNLRMDSSVSGGLRRISVSTDTTAVGAKARAVESGMVG
jgi:hypothetical protein